MLTISEEQMINFNKAMFREFEDRMIIHLRNNFSENTKKLSNRELINIIKTSIKKAKKYQVTFEYDIQRYIEYAVVYIYTSDENIDTTWADSILDNKELTSTEKMDLLDESELIIIRDLA